MDHAGALGDGPDFDLPAPQLKGDGNLLFHRVGGHDGGGGGVRAVSVQGGGGFGQAGLNGLDVDGLADHAGGTDHKVLRLPAGGQGAHGLGILMAHGTAGVGVAAVGHHAPGGAVLQVVHSHIDGSRLHPVHGVHSGGGALLVRQNQRQVVLGGAAALLHAAVDAGGLEALSGAHAAVDKVQHSSTSLFELGIRS